jgi:uncharacterized membrane protein YagU involved in acid resistance
MMWIGIVVGALSCYVLKLAGLSLPKRVLDDHRVRKLALLLPVALLAALTITQTFSQGQRIVVDARLAGVVVAVFAVVLRLPFLAVVGLAAGAAALVRLIT